MPIPEPPKPISGIAYFLGGAAPFIVFGGFALFGALMLVGIDLARIRTLSRRVVGIGVTIAAIVFVGSCAVPRMIPDRCS